ncbi:STAM-binding protein-like A [Cotesia glomerata]|uniref:STAM-binding protein-like A n=1 Tax=Cotesia glomerata TaxID=32391 RepID=UPI001D007544|nr:STAM-binding protein-like A [Cotesia glomerata]XP_044582810.1 STAM-binding protein-like A [Cotesia glomerata]
MNPRRNILIGDPQARIKQAVDSAAAVEVKFAVEPMRYYRSGIEMIRQATIYRVEGDIEAAFHLYLKFLTIFIEKIDKHPQYNTINKGPVKTEIKELLRETLPIVESLKQQLLEKYNSDAKKYHEEKERLETVAEKPVEEKISVQIPDDSEKDKKGLRDIIVPTKIIKEFLTLAYVNTASNKETCGILAGRLQLNRLTITHLLIPKQSGSSDSCSTQSEEKIFEYQDQHDLITLGWIHTHPTQTAFLSSVDLHTHCAYQFMMSEAIAIVCAPKCEETGYFTLTEHGLNFISRCRESGFHPHPNEKSLYTHAQHCKFESTADVKVIDLRAK